MKALIYRTSNCYHESTEAPLLMAKRIPTDKYDYCSDLPLYAWMLEINSLEDLKEIETETGMTLLVSFCAEKTYGQDLNIEIYDDYRE